MNPPELLGAAKLLADFEGNAPPSDSRLRRAISTAYYAIFHAALTAAAEGLAGQRGKHSRAYGLIYRGFEHRRMKDVCEAVRRTTLRPKYQAALGRTQVHRDLLTFCGRFVALPQFRHLADYDPQATVVQADAFKAISLAEQAIAALDAAPPDQRADFLALLLVDTRS